MASLSRKRKPALHAHNTMSFPHIMYYTWYYFATQAHSHDSKTRTCPHTEPGQTMPTADPVRSPFTLFSYLY